MQKTSRGKIVAQVLYASRLPPRHGEGKVIYAGFYSGFGGLDKKIVILLTVSV